MKEETMPETTLENVLAIMGINLEGKIEGDQASSAEKYMYAIVERVKEMSDHNLGVYRNEISNFGTLCSDWVTKTNEKARDEGRSHNGVPVPVVIAGVIETTIALEVNNRNLNKDDDDVFKEAFEIAFSDATQFFEELKKEKESTPDGWEEPDCEAPQTLQ